MADNAAARATIKQAIETGTFAFKRLRKDAPFDRSPIYYEAVVGECTVVLEQIYVGRNEFTENYERLMRGKPYWMGFVVAGPKREKVLEFEGPTKRDAIQDLKNSV